jgi:hypothetical protein
MPESRLSVGNVESVGLTDITVDCRTTPSPCRSLDQPGRDAAQRPLDPTLPVSVL